MLGPLEGERQDYSLSIAGVLKHGHFPFGLWSDLGGCPSFSTARVLSQDVLQDSSAFLPVGLGEKDWSEVIALRGNVQVLSGV